MQLYFSTHQQARDFAVKSAGGKVKDHGTKSQQNKRWAVELSKQAKTK